MKSISKRQQTKTLRDCFWLWGQSPGGHHAIQNNLWKLPGKNIMTPLEGACYLGIPNCCRVVIGNDPKPPFDQYSMALVTMQQVVWSILGAAESNHAGLDLDEVLRQASMFPNITGGVLDDFFTQEDGTFRPRMSIAELRNAHERLHANARPLDMWIVVYEYQLDKPVAEHLNECDVVTFWTWKGSELAHLDRNFDRVKKMTPGKRRLAGCYMWDYGDAKPLTLGDMKLQCEKYLQWMRSGDIEGIIFCSNCIADIGLETVEWTRNWIKTVSDEKI